MELNTSQIKNILHAAEEYLPGHNMEVIIEDNWYSIRCRTCSKEWDIFVTLTGSYGIGFDQRHNDTEECG